MRPHLAASLRGKLWFLLSSTFGSIMAKSMTLTTVFVRALRDGRDPIDTAKVYELGYIPSATNPEAKKSWDEQREKNAKGERIEYKPLALPTAEQIAAWKKRMAEFKARRDAKANGGGRGGGAPGGGTGGAAIDDFFAELRDLDDPDVGV